MSEAPQQNGAAFEQPTLREQLRNREAIREALRRAAEFAERRRLLWQASEPKRERRNG